MHSCNFCFTWKTVCLTRVYAKTRQSPSETRWRNDVYSPKAGTCLQWATTKTIGLRSSERGTCRKLLDLSGTVGNIGTTRCLLGFADASVHLYISRDLLDLSCHVSRWRGKRPSRRRQDWRVENHGAARSVGGSRSVRISSVHHDRCRPEVAVA